MSLDRWISGDEASCWAPSSPRRYAVWTSRAWYMWPWSVAPRSMAELFEGKDGNVYDIYIYGYIYIHYIYIIHYMSYLLFYMVYVIYYILYFIYYILYMFYNIIFYIYILLYIYLYIYIYVMGFSSHGSPVVTMGWKRLSHGFRDTPMTWETSMSDDTKLSCDLASSKPILVLSNLCNPIKSTSMKLTSLPTKLSLGNQSPPNLSVELYTVNSGLYQTCLRRTYHLYQTDYHLTNVHQTYT